MKYLIVILLSTITTCSFAQRSEIFIDHGKAIGGYDVVAFFKESKPVMGNDSLSFTYKNVLWTFSSRANLNAFAINPEMYMPQYGGYCAYGTADGHKAPTQPGTWTIVDNKLYFNYNDNVKKLWDKNRSGLIEKADREWPLIKDKE